ncbi:3950_t:CDS:2, partial [Acaulospora morrowiae]
MKIWVENVLARNDLNLSDSVLMEKALAFAKEFEVFDKFLASMGWQLQDIIKNYESKNIFNYNETALYWMLEPNRTLVYGPVKGK